MSARIVLTLPALPEAAQALLARHELHFAGPRESAPGQLADFVRARDPHALFVRFGRIDAQVLEAAPSLRVIARHGSGLDTIDLECARARGIAVSATPGANAVAVAEHALALLLACAKGVARLDARMHTGHWDKAAHQGMQLAGRTLGIIGLGPAGLRMARLAGAIGMRVIAATRTPRAVPRHVRLVALDDLWPACDAISLHCALNAATQGIVNAGTLARCRHGVLLVNTGRGGLLDDAALVAALRSGQVCAAGLDTFTREPAGPDNPYAGLANAVLTPHVGAATPQAFESAAVQAARQLLAGLRATGKEET